MYISVTELIYRIFRDFPSIHSFDRLLLLGLQCKEKKTMINHKINVSQREKTFLWTCAPSEDSDSRRVIRFFTKRILNSQRCSFFMLTTKTLIRMRGCAGWFESPLEYVFSRCGSNYVEAVEELKESGNYSYYGYYTMRCLSVTESSRKHAYIPLTPSNPTFI